MDKTKVTLLLISLFVFSFIPSGALAYEIDNLQNNYIQWFSYPYSRFGLKVLTSETYSWSPEMQMFIPQGIMDSIISTNFIPVSQGDLFLWDYSGPDSRAWYPYQVKASYTAGYSITINTTVAYFDRNTVVMKLVIKNPNSYPVDGMLVVKYSNEFNNPGTTTMQYDEQSSIFLLNSTRFNIAAKVSGATVKSYGINNSFTEDGSSYGLIKVYQHLGSLTNNTNLQTSNKIAGGAIISLPQNSETVVFVAKAFSDISEGTGKAIGNVNSAISQVSSFDSIISTRKNDWQSWLDHVPTSTLQDTQLNFMYHLSWVNLLSNLLPSGTYVAYNGNAVTVERPMISCSKLLCDSATWDTEFSTVAIKYFNSSLAKDILLENERFVQFHSADPNDGFVWENMLGIGRQGYHLPSMNAIAAWDIYQYTKDKAWLNSIYPWLKAHFTSQYRYPRWAKGDGTLYTTIYIYYVAANNEYMKSIAQELNYTGDVQTFENCKSELLSILNTYGTYNQELGLYYENFRTTGEKSDPANNEGVINSIFYDALVGNANKATAKIAFLKNNRYEEFGIYARPPFITSLFWSSKKVNDLDFASNISTTFFKTVSRAKDFAESYNSSTGAMVGLNPMHLFSATAYILMATDSAVPQTTTTSTTTTTTLASSTTTTTTTTVQPPSTSTTISPPPTTSVTTTTAIPTTTTQPITITTTTTAQPVTTTTEPAVSQVPENKWPLSQHWYAAIIAFILVAIGIGLFAHQWLNHKK